MLYYSEIIETIDSSPTNENNRELSDIPHTTFHVNADSPNILNFKKKMLE